MSDDTRIGQTATQAGSPNAPQANDERRPSNPLSKYASYTYQLALYAITPEYYKLYKSTNDLNTQDPNVALILQSGGVNNNSNRAAGFEFDYYIDDLKLEAYVAPESRQTSTVTYGIEFKIYEALGFKFVTNLFQTLQSLKSVSNELKNLSNASRQLFVLTIKFLGYDIQGNPIQDDIILGLNKYYDIMFTEIKFKLDGKITVYNLKGIVTRMDVMGPKKGLVDKGAYNLYGSTVGDVLTKLMTKLTEDRKRNSNNTPSDTFRVEFVGSGADEIKNATFATPENPDKQTNATTPPNIKNTTEVTPAVELKAVPRSNEKEIKINGGTPITKAVEEIIKLSTYNSDALAKVVSNDKQPGPGEQQRVSNKKFASYYLTPVISNVKRNDTLGDYAYDIVYKIQKYETPDISAPYVTQTSSYYGPVKEYKYYYTGENSEVIRFEQEFDNTYFTVSLNADESVIPRRVDGDVPVSIATPSGGSPQGVNNPATLTPQNSAITYLLDPAKIARAKIEILGDPDWLGQDVVSTTRYINENNKTINYSAQQVFIEIKVQEPIDYNHKTGLLDLNENILFWSYPESKRKDLRGKISYKVIKVTSTFKSGKFTQVLDCVITTFPADPKPENQSNQRNAIQAAVPSPPTQGLTYEPNALDPYGQIFVGTGTAAEERARFNPASQQVNRTGTANDDESIPGVTGVNISDVIVAP
jgi:hypothetical protein